MGNFFAGEFYHGVLFSGLFTNVRECVFCFVLLSLSSNVLFYTFFFNKHLGLTLITFTNLCTFSSIVLTDAKLLVEPKRDISLLLVKRLLLCRKKWNQKKNNRFQKPKCWYSRKLIECPMDVLLFWCNLLKAGEKHVIYI